MAPYFGIFYYLALIRYLANGCAACHFDSNVSFQVFRKTGLNLAGLIPALQGRWI
jgi:hypothetical protein